MTQEHFFVTGALGCIGAWAVKNLIEDGAAVTVFDLGTNKHRLELVMSADVLDEINFVHDNITNTEAVISAVAQCQATHILHLAALQVPFCKANPVMGASVNVVGTVNVFEAAKKAGIPQVTYASSLAVYGAKELYEEELLTHHSAHHPGTLYGVYKQANEGTGRIYWQNSAIASLGLRPYTVYGPARDQGMTSTPTKAMLAAAMGRPYHISFGGYSGFQLADDVAKTLIQMARTPFQGSEAYNIAGQIVHMREVVAAIEAAEPSARGQITFEDSSLPFPKGQKEDELQALLGTVPNTPLAEGVAGTIEHFKRALAEGRVDWQD